MIINTLKTRNDFQNFIHNNTDKVIIIKCYANWCNPCKKIHKRILELFNSIHKPKALILVNIDESPDIASYLKVRSIPLFISYINGEKCNIVEGTNNKSIEYLFTNI